MEKDSAFIHSRRVATSEEIYTNVDGPYNLRKQIMYCQYCKYEIVTDLPGAQCRVDDSYLITVVGSVLNELA